MPEWRLALYRGKWCAYARDETGQPVRRSLGTDDRAVAERRFAAFVAETNRPADTTVAHLWDAYCEDRKGRRVLRAMASEWKSLQPVFGHLYPHQVTVQMCREYVAARRALGRQDGTIWTELGHLRIVLNWAEKRGLIERAPYIEQPAKPPARERHLTPEEAERLIAAAAPVPHVRLFILLALYTAGRSEALLQLTRDRVDLDRGQIRLAMWDGKRRKGRATVPMNRRLRAALAEAREGAVTPWVVEYAGRRVTTIRRGFLAAVERAGLDASVTPHALRRTAAVWLAEAGVSMQEIAQFLGHEDSRTTERIYARYSPHGLRRAADALDRVQFEPESNSGEDP